MVLKLPAKIAVPICLRGGDGLGYQKRSIEHTARGNGCFDHMFRRLKSCFTVAGKLL